jgi:hypothetical protein
MSEQVKEPTLYLVNFSLHRGRDIAYSGLQRLMWVYPGECIKTKLVNHFQPKYHETIRIGDLDYHMAIGTYTPMQR